MDCVHVFPKTSFFCRTCWIGGSLEGVTSKKLSKFLCSKNWVHDDRQSREGTGTMETKEATSLVHFYCPLLDPPNLLLGLSSVPCCPRA